MFIARLLGLDACIQGSIIDIIVNLDKTANNYLIPQYFTLSMVCEGDKGTNQLFIPPNYAHGFLTLEENTIILYHFSDIFKPRRNNTYSLLRPTY